MNQSYDVVIVGGGVVGSAIAYFLSASPEFQGRIAVVERDPNYLASSSSLSTSAIRQQFGTRPNIQMSSFSIDFLRSVKSHLSVGEIIVDIGLKEPGYLYLATPQQLPAFEAKNAVQRACGCTTQLLAPPALAGRFPWLNTADLGAGSYGSDKEGWFDGPALLQAFKRKARSQGVSYLANEVVGFGMASPHSIDTLLLANAESLSAGTVVNAAGAWSRRIARMAGVDLPVVPSKRCVFVFDSPQKMPGGPFVFDPSGLFFRPEGHLYICGISPPVENDPEDFTLEVDYALFDDLIWPALAHRVPGFEELKLLRGWAGLYEYNTFDHSGIIGRHPTVGNFVIASGFSGHGMMHAPATGASVSELILHGQSRSIDLAPFRVERIEMNDPIVEDVY